MTDKKLPEEIIPVERMNAKSQKKALTKKQRVVFVAAICIVLAALFFGFLKPLYKNVIGSAYCVIAQDYSSITMFGQRYVPLVVENAFCETAQCIVSEAQVEGSTFLDKLLFGEMIYAVKGCTANEIICLQSEYDLLESEYYCLESMVSMYQAMAKEVPYDRLCAEIDTKSRDTYYLDLSDALSETLINSEDEPLVQTPDYKQISTDEYITIYARQSTGPFKKAGGVLIRKWGDYYWYIGDSLVMIDEINGICPGFYAYAVGDEYDTDLEMLFARVNQ